MSGYEKVRVSILSQVNQLMADTGVSQVELANRLGITRQRVCQILADKNNFTIRSLVRIAAALGCRVEVTLKWKV